MSGRYVLLSACKDESEFIGLCLESVRRQTVPPLAWVIVDDGSDDDTCAIIESYRAACPYIQLVRLPRGRARCFGAKDRAINLGYQKVREMDFDLVGVLDTDVSLESPNYYESILEAFAAQPDLAVAGGMVHERRGSEWSEREVNASWSVAGCVQVFRRACFDAIGGFVPLPCGGSDTLAELQLRMQGWTTRSLPGLPVYHYRPTSSAGGLVRGYYRLGVLDAAFGSHPVFMLVKCLRRMSYRPFIVGAVALYTGYLLHHLRGDGLMIPSQVSRHLRKEQTERLGRLVGLRGARLPDPRASPRIR
jgi:glycosyltransferase involved in cell wall biosynthesis